MQSTPNDKPNPFVAIWANATTQAPLADSFRGVRIDPAITELMNAIDSIDTDLIRRYFPMTTSTSTQAPARFIRQYIRALLWSTTGDDDEPLEDNHGVSDIAPETMQRITDDCGKFWAMVESMGIDLDNELLTDDDATEMAAHDFWLTRNGHGAGFWDGDWSDSVKDRLTKLAKSFGEQWPYVGDDGLIYL